MQQISARTARVAACSLVYGFDGVVNHGQLAVSNSMSARQLSSSGSCCGPPVPMLEPSHIGGRSGAGGVLVTLTAVPSLPLLSCQQLPVLPRYWSHQKSVRPVVMSPVPLVRTVPLGDLPITLP